MTNKMTPRLSIFNTSVCLEPDSNISKNHSRLKKFLHYLGKNAGLKQGKGAPEVKVQYVTQGHITYLTTPHFQNLVHLFSFYSRFSKVP